MYHIQENKHLRETDSESRILQLADKDFLVVILNILRELKEIMLT